MGARQTADDEEAAWALLQNRKHEREQQKKNLRS